jgi:hypothetical protein
MVSRTESPNFHEQRDQRHFAFEIGPSIKAPDLLADFERFLYTVKEKEKDIKPFAINGVKADKLPEVMALADIPLKDIFDTMVYERDRLLKAS